MPARATFRTTALTATGVPGIWAWTSGRRIIVDTNRALDLTASQARSFAAVLLDLAEAVDR